MKRTLLEYEPLYDFRLLALTTPLHGYTLAWWLERKLKIPLQRSEDLHLILGRNKQEAFFQVFVNLNEEESFQRWTLFGNRSSGGFLIPEQKVVDYYIKFEGDVSDLSWKTALPVIKDIPGVQHVFEINPDQLKSKANLVL